MLSEDYLHSSREQIKNFIPDELVSDLTFIVGSREKETPLAVIIADTRNGLYCLDAEDLSPIRNELQISLFAQAYAEKLVWALDRRQDELEQAEEEHARGMEGLGKWGEEGRFADLPDLPLDERQWRELHFQMGGMLQVSGLLVEEIKKVRALSSSYVTQPAIVYLDEVQQLDNSFTFLIQGMKKMEEIHKAIVTHWVYSGKFSAEELASNLDLENFLAGLAINELDFVDAPEPLEPKALQRAVADMALQVRWRFERTP